MDFTFLSIFDTIIWNICLKNKSWQKAHVHDFIFMYLTFRLIVLGIFIIVLRLLIWNKYF